MVKGIQRWKNKINKLIKRYKQLRKKLRESQILSKALKEQEYQIKYKYCPKKVYKSYDKIQNSRKLRLRKFNKIKKFDSNKLKSLLNNLNALNNNEEKSMLDRHQNKIIKKRIFDKLDESIFLQVIEYFIYSINKTWPYSKIQLLKSELNNIDFSNLDLCSPLSYLKVDSFLNLSLTPSQNFNTNNNNIKILGIKNSSKIPLFNGIKFIDPISKKKMIFNKEFIKSKISKNIGIINSYYKMLQKFTNIKHLELNQLIRKINKVVDYCCIYFCDIPIKNRGFSISNGNIYIAGDYLYEALGKTKEYKRLKNKDDKIYYKLTSICKIYLTLLHEFSKQLYFFVRKRYAKNDARKNNFLDNYEEVNIDNKLEYFVKLPKNSIRFQTKDNYINLHQNQIYEECSDFFDRELYLGTPFPEAIYKTSEFFICDKCDSYNNYIKKLTMLRKNTSDSDSDLIIPSVRQLGRCHFSIMRYGY